MVGRAALFFWSWLWTVLISLDHGMLNALNWAFVLLLATALLRREWLALGAILILLTIILTRSFSGGVAFVEVACTVLINGIAILISRRFGLLTLSSAVFVWLLCTRLPVTLDFTAWYVGKGMIAALIVAGVATYGFVMSLGGRSLFGQGFFGEDWAYRQV